MTPGKDAVIFAEPAEKAVARPWKPWILLMFATLVLSELQATDVVKSCVLLSERIPVALYCRVVPLAIMAEAGVTTID